MIGCYNLHMEVDNYEETMATTSKPTVKVDEYVTDNSGTGYIFHYDAKKQWKEHYHADYYDIYSKITCHTGTYTSYFPV